MKDKTEGTASGDAINTNKQTDDLAIALQQLLPSIEKYLEKLCEIQSFKAEAESNIVELFGMLVEYLMWNDKRNL